MEEVVIARRKIWLQGGHSYSIVLPKEWCEEQGWTEGDEILIKTDGRRLILEKGGGE